MFLFRIIGLALLLASCATPNSTSTESFSFKSRDWIKPSIRDLTATVQVHRVSPDLYTTGYIFDTPVDPLRGTSPTAFHLFAFCVAAKLAAQNKHTYWSLGTVTPDLKYSQTREVELLVAVGVSDTDRPFADPVSRPIRWLAPASSTASIRSTCEGIMREERLWSK